MSRTVIREAIVEMLWDEMEAADEKFGEQNHAPERWLAILAEEFGEASKEVVELVAAKDKEKHDLHFNRLQSELLQTGAMALMFIDSMIRNSGSPLLPPVRREGEDEVFKGSDVVENETLGDRQAELRRHFDMESYGEWKDRQADGRG